jgi:uncharacterized protein with FMN-binding domain
VITTLIATTLIGTVTLKESCHEFNCKVVKRLNLPCKIQLTKNQAEIFGTAFTLKQFQWGAKDGYHAQSGNRTLSVFIKGNKLDAAYFLEYSSKSDYIKWTCKF